MPTALTDEWIEEQLRLCGAATEEPWRTERWPDQVDICNVAVIAGAYAGKYYVAPAMLPQNAIFIAAAREGYSLVLREVLRLRKQRCETCHFFHYDDLRNEWLCSLRITDNMPDWYCADWKPREVVKELEE